MTLNSNWVHNVHFCIYNIGILERYEASSSLLTYGLNIKAEWALFPQSGSQSRMITLNSKPAWTGMGSMVLFCPGHTTMVTVHVVLLMTLVGYWPHYVISLIHCHIGLLYTIYYPSNVLDYIYISFNFSDFSHIKF